MSTITVTLNDEQIRAAIMQADLPGPVKSLDMTPANDQSPYATIVYSARGVVSAEERLSSGEICSHVRNYLRQLEYGLQSDAPVSWRHSEETGFEASLSVQRIAPAQGVQETTG